ncbi:MAG: SHOCT domain-containing protein [Tolypothrix sp. T3-bin4]|jgi:TM2 domain-containing membrane protein YozV|nr:SHOCT domain-containing protein [Tolypothrix sp. T3-bin4]
MLNQMKNRKIAAILAFAGTISPVPAGLHKFYLGQPWWGLLYMLLSWTPIPRAASAMEGFWYLSQDSDEFDHNFNLEPGIANFSPLPNRRSAMAPNQVSAIADALRELDDLRQDGLISEYEFEQKRRQLLDRIR